VKTQSDEIDKFAAAFTLAQAEMADVVATQTAKVTSNKGTWAYKFCDLAAVREVLAPVLAKHGFGVLQTMVPRREGLVAERWAVLANLRTVLLHTSGQWIAGEQPIAADWTAGQAVGSAITYARRYGLAAICGIAQVDDDGASAGSPPARHAGNANGHANGHAPPRPSNGPPPSDGPPIEDFDEFDDGPSPGSGAYYRQHPDEAQRGQGVNDFARQEIAGRFSSPPPVDGPPAENQSSPVGGIVAIPHDPPRTGPFLFGWVKENDQWPYFNYLAKKYPTQVPQKITTWDRTTVKWAWEQYVLWRNSGEPLPTVATATSNGHARH
jgi:hypothetical protein